MTKEEMWRSIEKLSELRSNYSCFDEEEEPFYYALTLGIKALEQELVLDKIRAEIQNINLLSIISRGDIKRMALDIIDKYKDKVGSEDKTE